MKGRTKSSNIANSSDFTRLVDEALRKRIAVTQNGKRSRVTTFEAIYRRMLQRELADDAQAFKARLALEKFAREQTLPEKRHVTVIGGLPGRDLR